MTQASPYQPLHHKYRPQRFDQLVGQEAIAATLTQALQQNRIAPAYLFSGPRGTGKTSSARILARSLNCQASEGPTAEPCGRCALCIGIAAGSALDVIEIDAASNTGVDNIRELIERSRFAPVQARWKVYVVDECHMLSTAAFNALLKTLEEPPPRVVFVLATTDPQRVLPTILSRCQRFDFRRIPLEDLEGHLRFIAGAEAIGITPEALHVVAQRAQGGLRDAESLLDQLSLLPAPIEAGAVWDLLGAVPEQELLELAESMVAGDPLGVIEASRRLLERGREPGAVLQGLTGLLRDLVLARVAPERQELSSFSPPFRPRLVELACAIPPEQLLHWQSQLKGSEQQLRHSVQPRLWLEVLLLGLLAEPVKASRSAPARAEPPGRNPAHLTQTPIKAPTPAHTGERPAPTLVAAEAQAPAAASADAPAPVITAASASPVAGAGPRPPAHGEIPLGELWQQVLSALELPSTRMLLSQQAELVRLDGQRAVVQVASTWMAMVQSRLPLLEKAVATTLGSPRQVVLEGSNPATMAAAPAPASPPSPAQAGPTGPPRPRADAPAGATPAAADTLRPPPTDPAPTAAPTSSGSGAMPGASGLGGATRRDQLDENARRLAEFFNGEVVELDGPLEDGEAA
ncbi:DNA polymerase III subunit gamma/tau [Cyanobium sp. Morenito 9A2]|uniref:DNA polymerase III subunit gamma/tau n=1 Tax=Cyanobium sp. Morenito 9A2 TaxID=2823718 RepID=UPI0020CC93EA|nr:DNA polymerase III subunit gamma/tau [Cyanobium sp. Morenito 9A2]MCP9850258.1 DNA polymerase III subunit gamma/tau [Cyanobium sp. Morenito 9A2]